MKRKRVTRTCDTVEIEISPWEIPEFLRLTDDQRRKAWEDFRPQAADIGQRSKVRDFQQPKGMSDEEWEIAKSQFGRLEIKDKEALVVVTEKSEGKKRAARSNLPDKAKIRVLLDKNPHEKGSQRYERFAKFRTGMTVAQAVEKGVTKAELRWSVVAGLIAIEGK